MSLPSDANDLIDMLRSANGQILDKIRDSNLNELIDVVHAS